MTAADDLLAIVQGVQHLTPAMIQHPILTTQATVDAVREQGDDDDAEALDWLLHAKALLIATPEEMRAARTPVRYTNRAARRARAKRRK